MSTASISSVSANTLPCRSHTSGRTWLATAADARDPWVAHWVSNLPVPPGHHVIAVTPAAGPAGYLTSRLRRLIDRHPPGRTHVVFTTEPDAAVQTWADRVTRPGTVFRHPAGRLTPSRGLLLARFEVGAQRLRRRW